MQHLICFCKNLNGGSIIESNTSMVYSAEYLAKHLQTRPVPSFLRH